MPAELDPAARSASGDPDGAGDAQSLEVLVDGLRQAADTVARLQRSLENCLDRAERARENSVGGTHEGSRTLHLVGRRADDRADRRPAAPLGVPLSVHGFEVDPGRHTVTIGGRRVLLTPNEWQLFALMVARPGSTLSRDELAIGAWGSGFGGRDSEVEVYISRLRRKLESDPRRPLIIETVRGAGYRLTPPDDLDDIEDASRGDSPRRA